MRWTPYIGITKTGFVVGIFLLLAPLSAFSESMPEPSQHPLDYLATQPYLNTKAGFSFRPPNGWTADESGESGTIVFFLNPQSDQEDSYRFPGSINIMSESTEGLDLRGYVTYMKERLPEMLQQYKLVEEKEINLDGHDADLRSATFVQHGYRHRNLQLTIVEKGKSYVVLATVLESAWDKYREVLEASLLTFKLK